MKSLNLLKSNKKSIFLNSGKGQEVKYLELDEEIGLKALKEDVKAGATHFKECLEVAEKKPSRVVVINCSNEEEGLMAVSYLATAYNQAEEYCMEADDTPDYYAEESCDWNIEDFEKAFSLEFEELGPEDEDPEEYHDEEEEWEENAQKVPIITLREIKQYFNNGFSNIPFSNDDEFMSGLAPNRRKEPYWLSLREEPICIVVTEEELYDDFSLNFYERSKHNNLCEALERFKTNRHIYVLAIATIRRLDETYTEEDGSYFLNSVMKQKICEVLLEYTATLVEVKSTEEAMKQYYRRLFDSWASQFGMTFAKGFPKSQIADQIVAMKNPEKSHLIERVYQYVLAQGVTGKEFTKEHFAIISKFKSLGVVEFGKKAKKKTNIQKLEESLVGMEEVKRQVRDIVNVMKFNKERAKRGLGHSGYHNVHMMLGAPGTAKTTVAQLMGEIMREENLLPDSRFVAINGADLKALYVGHSAPKTKAYFDNYDIILIDEAYSVVTEGEIDSFSNEAIAQLIIELEKHGMDRLVIFAGYGGGSVKEKDNKMLQFLNANPGIRSRINSTIYFKSYNPKEMVEIVHSHAKRANYILNKDADDLIYRYFAGRYQKSDFGNGREARSLLENITIEAARRVMGQDKEKITKRDMQLLTQEDVAAAIRKLSNSYRTQNGKL